MSGAVGGGRCQEPLIHDGAATDGGVQAGAGGLLRQAAGAVGAALKSGAAKRPGLHSLARTTYTAASRCSLRRVTTGSGFRGGTGRPCSTSSSTCSFMPQRAWYRQSFDRVSAPREALKLRRVEAEGVRLLRRLNHQRIRQLDHNVLSWLRDGCCFQDSRASADPNLSDPSFPLSLSEILRLPLELSGRVCHHEEVFVEAHSAWRRIIEGG